MVASLHRVALAARAGAARGPRGSPRSLDSFAPIRLLDAVVPFAGVYRPLWLGLGALAFDGLLAVVVTSLVRRRLGLRAWRAVHWVAYACWPVAARPRARHRVRREGHLDAGAHRGLRRGRRRRRRVRACCGGDPARGRACAPAAVAAVAAAVARAAVGAPGRPAGAPAGRGARARPARLLGFRAAPGARRRRGRPGAARRTRWSPRFHGRCAAGLRQGVSRGGTAVVDLRAARGAARRSACGWAAARRTAAGS